MASPLSIVAIIPLYNGAAFIREAIDSVLAQTLRPDEFIVVDDGSTDDGPRIVAEMARDHPITLLHKANGGQSSARNLGVASSKSALIALLDQDDGWYPRHLEDLVGPFGWGRNTPIGWVYGDHDQFDDAGKLVQRNGLLGFGAKHPKRTLRECLSEDLYVLPSASLIARTAFEAAGGFDERLSGYEDDDLFVRIFRLNYDHVFLPQAVLKWRIHLASASHAPRMARSRMIYARKLIEAFPDEPRFEWFWRRDCIAPRFLRSLAYEFGAVSRLGDKARTLGLLDEMKSLAPHVRPGRRRRLEVRLAVADAAVRLGMPVAARRTLRGAKW